MTNESLWYGSFGDEYTVRNDCDFLPRRNFWTRMMDLTDAQLVLEVGCSSGHNLELISDNLLKKCHAWGVDVNAKALSILHARRPGINAAQVTGFDLPFRDDYFDLVFTAGVLIHQRPEEVEMMMQEIIRVSAKYVLAVEYYNDIFLEVPYRGHDGALFKGPYGEIYERKYGLRLIERGRVGKADGFDDCFYWLLSKV